MKKTVKKHGVRCGALRSLWSRNVKDKTVTVKSDASTENHKAQPEGGGKGEGGSSTDGES